MDGQKRFFVKDSNCRQTQSSLQNIFNESEQDFGYERPFNVGDSEEFFLVFRKSQGQKGE